MFLPRLDNERGQNVFEVRDVLGEGRNQMFCLRLDRAYYKQTRLLAHRLGQNRSWYLDRSSNYRQNDGEVILSEVFPVDMNVKEEVLARLLDKGLICPDCKKVCKDLLVERFEHRIFRVDQQTKQLIPNPEYPDWEYNDHAFHCPHCDSLNIDDII